LPVDISALELIPAECSVPVTIQYVVVILFDGTQDIAKSARVPDATMSVLGVVQVEPPSVVNVVAPSPFIPPTAIQSLVDAQDTPLKLIVLAFTTVVVQVWPPSAV
jgi:hypothetical protein